MSRTLNADTGDCVVALAGSNRLIMRPPAVEMRSQELLSFEDGAGQCQPRESATDREHLALRQPGAGNAVSPRFSHRSCGGGLNVLDYTHHGVAKTTDDRASARSRISHRDRYRYD